MEIDLNFSAMTNNNAQYDVQIVVTNHSGKQSS